MSLGAIRGELGLSFDEAMAAINWMSGNGYITLSPEFRVLISRAQYVEKYGLPDGEETPFPAPEKTELEKARELWKYLNAGGASEKESKENKDDNIGPNFDIDDEVNRFIKDLEDDDEIEILDDDEDLEDYMEEDGAGRHYVEVDDDDDDDDDEVGTFFDGYDFDEDDEHVGAKVILQSSFAESLVELVGGNVCIFDLDGEPDFELKFIKSGCAVVISDGGSTVEETTLTRRRVMNILKSHSPVELNGDAIELTVENPSGLLLGLLRFYAAVDAVRKAK